jgi:hypothetical protein
MAAFAEYVEHAPDRRVRISVQVPRGDHDDAPATPVECLLATDVARPLFVVEQVVSTVALDRDPHSG